MGKKRKNKKMRLRKKLKRADFYATHSVFHYGGSKITNRSNSSYSSYSSSYSSNFGRQVWLSHPFHKHTGTWDITLDWTSKQRRKTFCIVLPTNWTKRNIRRSAHMYGQSKLAFLNIQYRGERWLRDLRRSRQVLKLWELFFLLLWGE